MAFLQAGKKRLVAESSKSICEYGRIYIFELELDSGEIVHKVGMVNSDSMSRVTDRLMEVLRSFFMTYRYVPRSKIVKAMKFRVPYYVENHLHKLLEDIRYRFPKKFDGSMEFFHEIDTDEFISYMESFTYDMLLKGETAPMDKTKYEKIVEAIRLEREAEEAKSKAKATDELPF
jgi:hypothetical protein